MHGPAVTELECKNDLLMEECYDSKRHFSFYGLSWENLLRVDRSYHTYSDRPWVVVHLEEFHCIIIYLSLFIVLGKIRIFGSWIAAFGLDT